jgi:hypothetical protein
MSAPGKDDPLHHASARRVPRDVERARRRRRARRLREGRRIVRGAPPDPRVPDVGATRSEERTSRAARSPLRSAPSTVPASAPAVASPAKKSVPATLPASASAAPALPTGKVT